MNKLVIYNFGKINSNLFILPITSLIVIFLFLFQADALTKEGYIHLQKDVFLFLNAKLSQFPAIEYQMTQLGDALVLYSFLAIFILYAPKIWEALLIGSIFSGIFTFFLKTLFKVPRPASAFDNSTIVTIGKVLCGHNSLPSGHTITIFTALTIIMFAFLPIRKNPKFIWYLIIAFVGFTLASTRVGVGAHYPLDVLIGSIIGYISGLFGIFFCRKYNLLSWIGNYRFLPFFIVVFIISCFILINKLSKEPLLVYYLALVSVILSTFKLTLVYVQKRAESKAIYINN